MHRITTFVQRLGDILLLSLRPVQLMLAISAFVVAIFVLLSGAAASSLYSLYVTTNAFVVVIMFIVYAGLSLYCSTTVYRVGVNQWTRYGTTIVGLVIWTITFILEVLVESTPLVGLHIVPVLAEGWILAQLMSDVRSQDRRVL